MGCVWCCPCPLSIVVAVVFVVVVHKEGGHRTRAKIEMVRPWPRLHVVPPSLRITSPPSFSLLGLLSLCSSLDLLQDTYGWLRAQTKKRAEKICGPLCSPSYANNISNSKLTEPMTLSIRQCCYLHWLSVAGLAHCIPTYQQTKNEERTHTQT